MERFKLTKTALATLRLPESGKRMTVYDTETPKLAARITASGTKTFYVVKRSGASMAWVRLGVFPDMTVEKARIEAALILGEFASGANPAKARRSLRGEPTFADIFEKFLVERKKRDGTHLSEKTKVNYRDVLRIYLGPIKNSKLSDIARSEIKTIHNKATKISHSQADRAVILVSSVFNFAADLELFEGTNPASRIQKNPASERDRFAQADELPHLFAAITESSLCDFFLLSLLTGARRSNVQEMSWRDIDLEAGIWRLDMTKNGTPQNVSLSPEAIAILEARKHMAKKSPFVFPSTSKTGHLVEPKTAWATIRRRASVYRILELLHADGNLSEEERNYAYRLLAEAPAKADKRYRAIADAQQIDSATYDMADLRIHDLRRTLGSWQAKCGASLAIIGKSLNHKDLESTRIYARLDLDPVRQSVNTATQAMLNAAKFKVGATPDVTKPKGNE
jgi:integrase